MSAKEPMVDQSGLHPFTSRRDAALAVLCGSSRLSLRAARFLGQMTVQRGALSGDQIEWFRLLLERAGLPPLVEDEEM